MALKVRRPIAYVWEILTQEDPTYCKFALSLLKKPKIVPGQIYRIDKIVDARGTYMLTDTTAGGVDEPERQREIWCKLPKGLSFGAFFKANPDGTLSPTPAPK